MGGEPGLLLRRRERRGGTHLRRSDGEAARSRLRRTHMADWAAPADARRLRGALLEGAAAAGQGGGEVGLGGGGAGAAR